MAPQDEIAALPNLGSKSSAMLASAGITRLDELKALGAVRAFLAVQSFGLRPSANLLYVIHGALTGRPWSRIPADERLDLVREAEFAGELTAAEPAPARRHPNHESIYAVVARIPQGRVATYGQVAELAGLPGHARQVGYALNKTPAGRALCWHRVLNAKGELSLRGKGLSEQQRLLEAEGIVFSREERVSLRSFQWRPRGAGGGRR